MRIARCRKVLGVDVDADDMAASFSRLGFEFKRSRMRSSSRRRAFASTSKPRKT